MMGVTKQYATTGTSSLQDSAVTNLAYQWCMSQMGGDWGLTDRTGGGRHSEYFTPEQLQHPPLFPLCVTTAPLSR